MPRPRSPLGRRNRVGPINPDTLEAVSSSAELLPLARAFSGDHAGFKRMAALLELEEYQTLNFGKLLEVLCKSEISFSELAVRYQNFQHAKVGLIRSYHMPRIMHNMTLDANPRMRNCRKCYGRGALENGDICPRCFGAGQVEKPADNKAREMILESAGMLGKSNGPLVNVNMSPISIPAMEQAVMEAAKVIAQPAPKQLEADIVEVIENEDSNVSDEGNGKAVEEDR